MSSFSRSSLRCSGSACSTNQRQSVADGEHDVGDASVVLDVVVEGDDCVVVLLLGVEDAAAPEDVIDGDQAVGGEQRQGGFEVVEVVALVGVDEDEVEGA